MTKDYVVSSQAYLRRAREQLDLNTNENLFYACFNLRSGIEARMQEYLEPHEHVSKNRKEAWNLDKLSESCRKYFKTNQRIQKVVISKPDHTEIATFYYIPVSTKLIQNGGKLGAYLHAMRVFKTSEDPWWNDLRKFAEETYSQLAVSCKGDLLGPVLGNKDNAKAHIQLPEMAAVEALFAKKQEIIMSVTYHDFDGLTLP